MIANYRCCAAKFWLYTYKALEIKKKNKNLAAVLLSVRWAAWVAAVFSESAGKQLLGRYLPLV